MLRVLATVLVLCVLRAPAIVTAGPTIELSSEAPNAGIPVEGIDVRLPQTRDLDCLGKSLERLAALLTDGPIRADLLDGSEATLLLRRTMAAEPAEDLHRLNFLAWTWTEAVTMPAWKATSGEPTLKVSWTETTTGRNQSPASLSDAKTDLR